MTAVEEPPFEIDPSAPVLLEPVPPDETFWRKHSPHLEMPTSFLIATFLLTAMFGVLVLFMLYALGPGPEKKVPTMGLVDGGDDLTGEGSPGAPGSGDAQEPLKATTTEEPTPDLPTLPDLTLPAVQDIKNAIDINDPTAPAPAIAPATVAAYGALDESIRKAMLGGKAGADRTGGTGGDSSDNGPGGSGSDKTRARSLRWVMLFKTSSGRDYLDQLHAMGAIVLVAKPQDKKEMFIFRDLKNPKADTASPANFAAFASQIQFNDAKSDAVRSVGQALGLGFTPDSFWAVFPKGIENELAALEASYQNRRAEDIEQTRFQVSMIGGRHRLVVADQRLRRK